MCLDSRSSCVALCCFVVLVALVATLCIVSVIRMSSVFLVVILCVGTRLRRGYQHNLHTTHKLMARVWFDWQSVVAQRLWWDLIFKLEFLSSSVTPNNLGCNSVVLACVLRELNNMLLWWSLPAFLICLEDLLVYGNLERSVDYLASTSFNVGCFEICSWSVFKWGH